MSKQPEALRLAEHLVDMSNKYRTPSHERGVVNGATQELRRLHAANAELVEALLSLRGKLLMLDPSADTAACDEALAAHSAAQAQAVEDELPPLPAPVFPADERSENDKFTATQMRDYARQARAGRASAQAVPAWRGIESAPKDGRKLILFYKNRNGLARTVMARWLTDDEAAETDADGFGLEGGWYECIDNWCDYNEVAIHEGEPTHWMPLPAAPSAQPEAHPAQPQEVPREWRSTLRKLAFMARTSGGAAGPDSGLMAVLSEAEALLSQPYLPPAAPSAQAEQAAQAAAVAHTQGALDVLAERHRQISTEGWTPEHDDEHSHGELALAASCYAEQGPEPYGVDYPGVPARWPWDTDWWKPRSYRRNLVKAGALILAEIERLDRKAQAEQGEDHV